MPLIYVARVAGSIGLMKRGNSPSRAIQVSESGMAAGCGRKVDGCRSAAAVTIGHGGIPNPR